MPKDEKIKEIMAVTPPPVVIKPTDLGDSYETFGESTGDIIKK